MKEVKIGLIGLGFMGSTHWRIYEALENVRVVALADVDPAKRAGDVSKVVGNIGGGDNSAPLNMAGVATYEDAFEMINATDADIIDIIDTTRKCFAMLCSPMAEKTASLIIKTIFDRRKKNGNQKYQKEARS